MKNLFKYQRHAILTLFLLTFFGASENVSAQNFPCSGDGSAAYKTAAQSLVSAAQIVLNDQHSAGADCVITNYISALQKPPYAMQKEYQEGLSFPQAAAFLKKYVAQPNNGNMRVKVIRDAFREVYGRDASSVEQAFWDAAMREEKAWFATILTGEIKKLNGNETDRRTLVSRVYMHTMGRKPNGDETKYWLPRTEHYRLMVKASRDYLYSSSGAKDYVGTLRNVIIYEIVIAKTKQLPPEAQNNPSPYFEAEAKKLMPKYTAQKLIFMEMIGGQAN